MLRRARCTQRAREALALLTEDAALRCARSRSWRTKPVSPRWSIRWRSYCIERLTADQKRKRTGSSEVIDARWAAWWRREAGYPQREVAESAYRDQRRVESKARTIVSVNAFVATAHEPVETL